MMKISFTTLGCPSWDLDTICARAREYGYDGVDFRGYLDNIDITQLPEFTSGVPETIEKFHAAGLEISGISSSITLCDPGLRQRNLEEARRTIPLAKKLQTDNVRVFGGGDLERYSRPELANIARECMNAIFELDGGRDIRWLFETHDHWIKSSDCRLLIETVNSPAFGALWDIGHTPRMAGETPAETYTSIGRWIGYTHIKDAIHDPGHPQAMEDGWRYVFPGQGQVPLAEAIQVLKENGYQGWLTFEHEKRWHPDLPEPEEAFPAYARWARSLIGGPK
jgi:sugar phosphate isomerase/epimerase